MELAAQWRAAIADDDLRRSWLDTHDDHDWEPVTVPGHWRNDAPFSDADGPLLYRTRFHHDGPAEAGERWWLRFDGVFYQGDVWLDGGYVGDTEGYFFPHTFEVTEALAAQREHTLGIEVASSPVVDRSTKRTITGAFGNSRDLDLRWNPGGIWRPVVLERTGPVRIRHLRVRCRDATEASANVALRAVLDASEATEVLVRTTVGDTEVVEQRRLAAGENQVEWVVRVDEPALWWPRALGDQPLHPVLVEVTLASPEGHPAADEPSHRIERRIGLRQVTMRDWVTTVNGERLFLKGVNLLPARQALGDATPEELRRDVALAAEAGLDLLRLRGHISRPELYDAADELGLLIWQDFPLQGGYARTIRKQAQRQAREAVDLLAHHPSVAIWCGHDEPVAVDDDPTDAPLKAKAMPARLVVAHELPSWNRTILDRTVKRTIDKADGTRPVIAHSGVLPHPPQLDGTSAHLSFGWRYGDATDLAGLARRLPRLVRFVASLGAQAVPASAGFAAPERWPALDWDGLAEHHGLDLAAFRDRVPPADHPTFGAWREASQALQADVVRRQVEALRRLKYRPTGGFAVHALADAHPAISAALLDHERVPKAAWAALRDACRPVIVTADHLPAGLVPGEAIALDVHVVSDLRHPVEDLEVRAWLTWQGGEQRWRFRGRVDADGCERVGTLQIEVPDRPGPMELRLALTGAGVPGGEVERLDRCRVVAR